MTQYKIVCPRCGQDEFQMDEKGFTMECVTEGCEYHFNPEQYDFIKPR